MSLIASKLQEVCSQENAWQGLISDFYIFFKCSRIR